MMRPILMSAPMIRALIDGTKSQTRRIVKLPFDGVRISEVYQGPGTGWSFMERLNRNCSVMRENIKCPYGVPGDTLYVKESIRRDNFRDTSHFMADGAPTKADAWPWKVKALSGRFMPMGLSRFTLTLTEVRAQRLHDISEEDARDEGVKLLPYREAGRPYRDTYARLWDEINGEGAWGLNPWVFALTFTVEAR